MHYTLTVVVSFAGIDVISAEVCCLQLNLTCHVFADMILKLMLRC